jgi:hypothetical protein
MPATVLNMQKKINKDMQKEYDFSKGKRGKFYHPDAKINLPMYLDPDVADFIKKYLVKKALTLTK